MDHLFLSFASLIYGDIKYNGTLTVGPYECRFGGRDIETRLPYDKNVLEFEMKNIQLRSPGNDLIVPCIILKAQNQQMIISAPMQKMMEIYEYLTNLQATKTKNPIEHLNASKSHFEQAVARASAQNELHKTKERPASAAVVLSAEQELVFRKLEDSSCHFFITGKAGTGKSVLLRHFMQNTKKKIVVLAPTGIAAINVQGQTIHRFFHLPPRVLIDYSEKDVSMSDDDRLIYQAVEAIVIDEISMVRSDVMNAIDQTLRVARSAPKLPFGGVQMIMFGDLLQIPPVVTEESINRALTDAFGTKHFFGAPALKESKLNIVELTEVFRQKDRSFVDALNAVRVGNITPAALSMLNRRCTTYSQYGEGVALTTTKKAAQQINDRCLAKLNGRCYEYVAEASGVFLDKQNISAKDAPADTVLRLKVGAKVIMIFNDKDGRWVNGTLATIDSLSSQSISIRIGEQVHSVERTRWDMYCYAYDHNERKLKQVVSGTFEQFPIRLAYAMTVHKAQGQTYDRIIVDYESCGAFEYGQTYVALSRCRSLDGITLTRPIRWSDIQVDQEALDFLQSRTSISIVPHIHYRQMQENAVKTPTAINKQSGRSYREKHTQDWAEELYWHETQT